MVKKILIFMVPIAALVVLFALLATLQFGWGVWTVLFVCGLGKPIFTASFSAFSPGALLPVCYLPLGDLALVP